MKTSQLAHWGPPDFPEEQKQAEIKKQLALLDNLRAVVEAGTCVSMAVVVVRDNFVPEHAFSVSPYTAAILLAGMNMAEDDLKANARRIMMDKRQVGDQKLETTPPKDQTN